MSMEDEPWQAIVIELRSTLREGWSVSYLEHELLVVGPDIEDFRSEVWRLANFIAYENFVSIERTSEDPVAYRISSRSGSGLFFSVVVQAASPCES